MVNPYRKLVVDGIISQADIESVVCSEPMFRLVRDREDTKSTAHLRASRPYTAADEKRWLAGVVDRDLDYWEYE